MKEFLTKLFGDVVTDEKMQQFDKEIGGRFVAKTDYNSKLEEIKGLNTQISERDKQLKTLKDSAGDNEELQKQSKKLQDENKQAQTNFDKQMHDFKFNSALEKELMKANALDCDLVKVKLDKTTMKLLEDGTIQGLSEQLEGVQKDFGYLFKGTETEITGAKPAQPGGTQPSDDVFLQGFDS